MRLNGWLQLPPNRDIHGLAVSTQGAQQADADHRAEVTGSPTRPAAIPDLPRLTPTDSGYARQSLAHQWRTTARYVGSLFRSKFSPALRSSWRSL